MRKPDMFIGMSMGLNPPESPSHWECDRCGEIFDGSDMTEVDDRWYCDDCYDIVLAMEKKSHD